MQKEHHKQIVRELENTIMEYEQNQGSEMTKMEQLEQLTFAEKQRADEAVLKYDSAKAETDRYMKISDKFFSYKTAYQRILKRLVIVAYVRKYKAQKVLLQLYQKVAHMSSKLEGKLMVMDKHSVQDMASEETLNHRMTQFQKLLKDRHASMAKKLTGALDEIKQGDMLLDHLLTRFDSDNETAKSFFERNVEMKESLMVVERMLKKTEEARDTLQQELEKKETLQEQMGRERDGLLAEVDKLKTQLQKQKKKMQKEGLQNLLNENKRNLQHIAARGSVMSFQRQRHDSSSSFHSSSSFEPEDYPSNSVAGIKSPLTKASLDNRLRAAAAAVADQSQMLEFVAPAADPATTFTNASTVAVPINVSTVPKNANKEPVLEPEATLNLNKGNSQTLSQSRSAPKLFSPSPYTQKLPRTSTKTKVSPTAGDTCTADTKRKP